MQVYHELQCTDRNFVKGKICMILWWKLILLMSVWGAEDMFATEGECCYNVSYTKTSGNRVANKKQKD